MINPNRQNRCYKTKRIETLSLKIPLLPLLNAGKMSKIDNFQIYDMPYRCVS